MSIAKGITVVGDEANPENVVIDGENSTTLTTDGQVRIYNPSGPVVFKGFTIVNGGTHGGDYFAILTKGNFSRTIESCIVIGHGSTVDVGADYGLWAYTGTGELVVKDNDFSDLYHGILLEQQSGPSTIEGNTFDSFVTGLSGSDKYGGRAIEAITYGGVNVTALQKVVGNRFTNFKSTGVLFSGGFSGQTPGKFTNVLIEQNDFDFLPTDIVNLFGAVYLKNVSGSLNDSPAGGVSADIRNNYIHVPSGSGILVTGLNGDISVSDNAIVGCGEYGLDAGQSLGSVIDASGNWWDSNAEADITAKIAGNVDYTPWLNVGTDTDAAAGFQGDFSYLNVSAASPQTGSIGRIQEAIDLVSGSTVNVLAGTYAENVTVNKKITLIGAGSGTDGTVIDPANGNGITLTAGGTSQSDRP